MKKPKRRVISRKVRVTPTEKPCNTCGKVFPIEMFHIHCRIPDGYSNRCKSCTKDYRHNLRKRKTAIFPCGERIASHKLTEADAKIIKELIAEREFLLEKANRISNRALAEKFDVSYQCIKDIQSGDTWKHV